MREADSPSIPRHVAIVMDGNGRWARKRLMPRVFGHKAGVDALVRTVRACADRGVRHLTVFAFSSENWKRPEDEVSGLMALMMNAVAKHMSALREEGVRVRIVGDRSGISAGVIASWDAIEAATAHNQRIELYVAFNYGGRWDIVQACRRLIAEGVDPATIDEASLARRLVMHEAPDPDLFIRTGGELRLSNFLLWQSAYAELHFSDCLWPDFDAEELDRALQAYARRERRFGRVTTPAAGGPAGDAPDPAGLPASALLR